MLCDGQPRSAAATLSLAMHNLCQAHATRRPTQLPVTVRRGIIYSKTSRRRSLQESSTADSHRDELHPPTDFITQATLWKRRSEMFRRCEYGMSFRVADVYPSTYFGSPAALARVCVSGCEDKTSRWNTEEKEEERRGWK
ncbi:hypothetical protein E2C01_010932 [Portunus trituberculatus]|uniref:Uncharacterized protein n=1 Tax=Portunus trituberculatus TaxID=210409 RepID=A0A5B7DA29_PORTR|nr:hypothetical protein [Portunus trituberculatus]